MSNTAQNSNIQILSATQLKDAGKNLHTTPLYSTDPHGAIRAFVEPFLPQINIGPAKILVATFRQPEKTAGGIIKTQRYIEEDKFQGIAGLVLKRGPLSFEDDARIKFGGFIANEWDWVIYKPENTRATELRGLHCRIIEDSSIDAVVGDPELLW